jgi:hypothetical protein
MRQRATAQALEHFQAKSVRFVVENAIKNNA